MKQPNNSVRLIQNRTPVPCRVRQSQLVDEADALHEPAASRLAIAEFGRSGLPTAWQNTNHIADQETFVEGVQHSARGQSEDTRQQRETGLAAAIQDRPQDIEATSWHLKKILPLKPANLDTGVRASEWPLQHHEFVRHDRAEQPTVGRRHILDDPSGIPGYFVATALPLSAPYTHCYDILIDHASTVQHDRLCATRAADRRAELQSLRQQTEAFVALFQQF